MTKILYVAPFCDPMMADGGSRRGINLLLQLQKEFEVILLAYRSEQAGDLVAWAKQRQVRLEWLESRPPSKPRLPYLQRLFSRRSGSLLNYDRSHITRRLQAITQKEGGCDLYYFATQLVGQAIPLLPASYRTILDLYDVYTTLLAARAQQIPPYRLYGFLYRLEARRMAGEERKILRKTFRTLVVSQGDQEAVQKLSPGSRVSLVPNGSSIPEIGSPRSGSQVVIMVASYYYLPNLEGLKWFLTSAWPRIASQQPQARMIAVGQGSEPLQANLPQDARVEFTGKVPDVAPFYQQAGCVIVPILHGGGSRLKLVEAMSWNQPVVATTKGAEGIETGSSVWIADQPEAFAEAVLACLAGGPEVEQKAHQARKIVEDRYSWDLIGKQLREIVKEDTAGKFQ